MVFMALYVNMFHSAELSPSVSWNGPLITSGLSTVLDFTEKLKPEACGDRLKQ